MPDDRLAILGARWRHWAVEGVIGAGKSTLARTLATRLDADLLLELPADNPFLARFYADGARYAFQTQLFFLFQRLDQVRDLSQRPVFERPLVADFMFEKDRLFAQLTLDDDEYRLYSQLQQQLASRVVRPDLVIWLRASTDTLVERIRSRGIAMERAIERDYLDRLDAAYARHFEATDPGQDVFVVDTEGFNPAGNPSHFDSLVDGLCGFGGGKGQLERHGPGQPSSAPGITFSDG